MGQLTINESSSESVSHVVNISNEVVGSVDFNRAIPATFVGGVAVISIGLSEGRI